MTTNCANCNESVPLSRHTCEACGTFLEFQNVRACGELDEEKSLDERVSTSWASARARGVEPIFKNFVASIQDSQAVVCKPTAVVSTMLSPPTSAVVSYYRQVGSGQRFPEDNIWDRVRPSVDELFFPYYKEDIIFGALSTNKLGVSGDYGACHLALKNRMIEKRATVFHENSINFCDRMRIFVGTSSAVPKGYRANWQQRWKVAAAKLEPKITSHTVVCDFPTVLLDSKTTPPDFVEVHIHGSVTVAAIDQLAVGPADNHADRLLALAVIERAKAANVSVVSL